MPGSETTVAKRGGKPLSLLFWAGVALAPLAAVVLLLSQSETMLRAAVVVAVLAVVLIGLSITLRPDPETVRLELEETLFDEVEALREDVRHDIGTAAKATHKAFGERVQALQETVDALRAQLDGRGSFDRPDVKAPPVTRAASGHSPVGGVVRHTETVQVTTRQTIVDADEGRSRVYGGSVYGAGAGEPAPPRGRADEWTPPPPSREPRGTRGDREPREQREESWTEKRLRERAAADRNRDADSERSGGRRSRAHASDPDRDVDRGPARGLGADPAADEGWSNIRAGDRWASVRSDERGRELRMGERRAAVHADENGTEFRIEDRWAAVRRDEPSHASRREARWTDDSDSGSLGDWSSRGGELGGWSSRGGDLGDWSSRGGELGGWSSRGGDSGGWSPREEDSGDWAPAGRRSARAALPAASTEPPASAWTQSRGDSESGGRRSRRRDDDDRWSDDRWERERDEPARVPRQRRAVDFETTDDRWR